MCRQQISYIDYVEAVEDIYKIERRETYFSFILRDFIQSVLSEDERLVAVWDNKGYGDSTKDPLHRRRRVKNKVDFWAHLYKGS